MHSVAPLLRPMVSNASLNSSMLVDGVDDVASFGGYSWNVFRYVGDYLHLLGIVLLLAAIAHNRSVGGISRSTQILYLLVFVTRYLDLLDGEQAFYLIFFKFTYISTSVVVLGLFLWLDATYERRNDTCSLTVIIVPCIVATLLLTQTYSCIEVLWTFSEFLEGFAMVPQYIFCYRERGQRDRGAGLYVISLGCYRVFYAMHWVYKKVQMPHYSDFQSWIGGLIEIMFFIDFLSYRFMGRSVLRSVVLRVDTSINEIGDQLELKVLGKSSRTPELEGGEMRRLLKTCVDLEDQLQEA